MKKVQIRSALSTGWSQFKRRPWYLLGLMLGFVAITMMTAGQNTMFTALSYIAYGGFLSMMLRHSNGEHIVFDDLFDVVDKRWIYFAFLAVVKTALIMLGFLCFIIPGVYLAIRWMFAELLVIDKGLRPLEALKASSKLTEGVRWKLFAFVLVVVLLSLLGLLALIIGVFVVGLVAQLAAIKVYKDLQMAEASEAEAIPEPVQSEG